MPRSVVSVKVVPLANVAASQTNGRPSGNPRGRTLVVGRQDPRQPAKILFVPRVTDIEIVGDVCTAMEYRGPPTDHDEVNARATKVLDDTLKVHAWPCWQNLAQTRRLRRGCACDGLGRLERA